MLHDVRSQRVHPREAVCLELQLLHLVFSGLHLRFLLRHESIHLLHLLLDPRELVLNVLDERRLDKELVLVRVLAAVKELPGRILGHDHDRVVHVDVEVIRHAVQVRERVADLLAPLVANLVVAAGEGDVALDGDEFAVVPLSLEGVHADVADAHFDLGEVGALADETLDALIRALLRTLPRAQANHERGQHG